MVFSRYVLDFLNESEGESEMNLVDRTNEVKAIINKIADSDIKRELLKNVELFGLKGTSKTLNFNSNNLANILKMLKISKPTANKKYNVSSNEKTQKGVQKNISFYSTGNTIIQCNATQSTGKKKFGTKHQELGVFIKVYNLLGKNEPKDYKIEGAGDKDIIDTIEFLNGDAAWDHACENQASMIVSKFGRKLLDYEFHRDSPLFNKLRNLAKKLSGLTTPDKWNPSDIYFIKQNFERYLQSVETITDLNDICGDESKIIGVSLKKGEFSALHGAISLADVYKRGLNLDIQIKSEPLTIKNGKLDDSQIDDICGIFKKIKILKDKQIHIACAPEANAGGWDIRQCLKNAKIDGQNFGFCYTQALKFLAEIDSIEKLKDVLFQSLVYALSRSPVSCKHYKTMSKLEIVEPSPQFEDFEFDYLRIPVTGDMAVIAEVKLESKHYKMQLRSKSATLPQFMMLRLKNSEKFTPLKNIKI